jgi:uncharacterized protein YkwD
LVASFALLLGSVACPFPSAVVAREPSIGGGAVPSEGLSLSAAESAAIARTNSARARAGLPPLSVDPQLMQSARSHARRMAGSRSLTHGSGVTENIGMGQTTASEAVADWMGSSGHRANILGSGHTRIGIAVAHAADGTPYWCQQFR